MIDKSVPEAKLLERFPTVITEAAILINITKPTHLNHLFNVRVDHTRWNGGYLRENNVTRPDREAAPFGPLAGALGPNNDAGLPDRGLYLLGFKVPFPCFYVGIAFSETIRTRLKKHRVKATASVSGGQGVNHTVGWRWLAYSRWKAGLHARPNGDLLEDCIVSIVQVYGQDVGRDIYLQLENSILQNCWNVRSCFLAGLGVDDVANPMIINASLGQGGCLAGVEVNWI